MKEITHPLVIKILDELEARIPESSSGTYNKQDPTACSKGHDIFKFLNTRIKIQYYDCTWGREFYIYIWLYTKDKSKWELVSNWYYSHKCSSSDIPSLIKRDKWYRYTYRLIKHYIRITKEIDHNYYDDCPHGYPADYI